MKSKPLKFAIGAVILLSAAYVAGSYYVGFKAEEHIRHIVKQAQDQSQGQLLATSINTHTGVFISSGEMVMAMPEIELDDQPVQFRIQYRIDHALRWSHLARFDWTATPQSALAQAFEEVYPTTLSLTGQGSIDWAGEGTTSIAFPGVKDADWDGQQLNLAALAGSLQVGSNTMDLNLNVPSLQLSNPSTGQTDTISNLSYQARSLDTRSGSVTLSVSADELQRIDPIGLPVQVREFLWLVDVDVADGVLALETRQTAASVTALNNSVTNLELGIALDGLHREDLARLSDWLEKVDGDLADLSADELNEGQNLLLEMLARGLTLRVPAVKGDLKLMGESSAQTVGLEGLVLSARVLDTATGAGTVSAALDSLTVPQVLQSLVPDVQGFKLAVTNRVNKGRTDLRIAHELARYQQHSQSLQDVKLDFQLTGLTPEQLGVLGELLQGMDGNVNRLSDSQMQQLQNVLRDAALHGLRLSVPVAQLTMATQAGKDAFNLEGFDVDIKLDDLATGAGRANLALSQLSASGPQMGQIPHIKGFTLSAENQVVDGLIDYQARATLAAFQDAMTTLDQSSVSMTLSGLAATDMQRLSELASAMENGLSTAEQNELTQIARRAIDSGFQWEIPALDVNIDSAQVQGQATLTLKGLDEAPLAAFDVARLAKLQADLRVLGQSPALKGLLAQGQAMGLLTTDANQATGKLVFDQGRLTINGQVMPVREYIVMANAMVQSALARSGSGKPKPQSQSKPDREQEHRPRRRAD